MHEQLQALHMLMVHVLAKEQGPLGSSINCPMLCKPNTLAFAIVDAQ